jgi:hypothetical protein
MLEEFCQNGLSGFGIFGPSTQIRQIDPDRSIIGLSVTSSASRSRDRWERQLLKDENAAETRFNQDLLPEKYVMGDLNLIFLG